MFAEIVKLEAKVQKTLPNILINSPFCTESPGWHRNTETLDVEKGEQKEDIYNLAVQVL